MFKYYKQETDWSCGAAVFRMILSTRKVSKSEALCRKLLKTNADVGTEIEAFGRLSKKFDLNWVEGRNATIRDLKKLLRSGWIVVVGYYLYEEKVSHYAIVKKITRSRVTLIDPYYGPNHTLSIHSFRRRWNVPMVDDGVSRWYFAVDGNK